MSIQKDIVTYATGKIAPAVSNLLLLILGVRLLGEAEFGKYSLTYWTILLIHMSCMGWVKQGILRFYTLHEGTGKQPFYTIRRLTFLASLVSLLALGILSFSYLGHSAFEFVVAAGFLWGFNYYIEQITIYQATLRSIVYTLAEVIFHLSWFVLFCLIFYFHIVSSYIYILLAGVVALLLSNIFLLVRGSMLSLAGQLRDKDMAKQILHYGIPMSIWLLGMMLFSVSDRYIIEYFWGYGQVGFYSAINDLAFKAGTFFCAPILLSLHPRIVNAWNEGQAQTSFNYIRNGTLLVLAPMLGTLVVFLLLRGWIFQSLMDLSETPSIVFIILVVCSAFFWQMAQFVHKPLELALRQRNMVYATVVALTFNVIGNFAFVPKYGYIAAAYTTFLGVIIYMLLIVALNKRALNKAQDEHV